LLVGAHSPVATPARPVPTSRCNERTMRGEARRRDGGMARGREGSHQKVIAR
jgi:hypothetical protein